MKKYFLLILLLIFSCISRKKITDDWRFNLDEKPVTSTNGMIASDAPLATKAGVDILKKGGNAIDATVATAFALAVVYPNAGNIGGGGFIVAQFSDGNSMALDFRETAPMAAYREMFVDDQGNTTDASLIGHLASGVPGSVAGLWEAHSKYGVLRWEEVIAPAIKLAEEGFIIDEDFARSLTYYKERFSRFESTAKLMIQGDTTFASGTLWKNPDLANTLKRISEQGPDGFYKGETADLIVAEMQRGGGLITHADLESYKPKWREPIKFDYRGKQIVSMAPVSSGGITLAIIFNILKKYDLAGMGWHSPQSVHLYTEAMRRAFAVRNSLLGDPDFVEIDREKLISQEYANELASTISLNRASSSRDVALAFGTDHEGDHTTHFSVIDKDGNAVAMTTTINTGYGSKVVVDGAGFFLNNEMDDFTSKPGEPNTFGLIQGEANAIEGGKRMLSSMTPTIVLDEQSNPMLITGASGGPTIITAVMNIVSNVLDYNMDISHAVNAPRIHHQHLPDILRLEKGGFNLWQIKKLRDMGHDARDTRIGNIGASILIKDGVYFGKHDPREDGLAEGY